jgi:hypothetical protein
MFTFNKVFFAFMVVAFSGSGNAAMMTANGSDVSFTYDDSLVGLFGTPTVSGDSLFFAPVNFSASREGITGTVYTDSSFKVTVNSLYGNTISKLALTELGDYTKEGPTANVVAKGTLTATDLTNSKTSINKINSTAPFAPTTFDGPTGLWQAKADATFSKSFSVEALIHNILGARNGSLDDFANINTTFVGLTASTVLAVPVVSAVPLPQAVWFFGAGLLGLISMSKRKILL